MADCLNQAQRHKNMAAIKGKNTKPEMVVRQFLWHHGFRYRINYQHLPGKPDIVFGKLRLCIFVNGCYWHGHDGCKYFVMPKTHIEFWTAKINQNKERDRQVCQQLTSMGWNCLTIWECQLKPKVQKETLETLLKAINELSLETKNKSRTLYKVDDRENETIAAEPEY